MAQERPRAGLRRSLPVHCTAFSGRCAKATIELQWLPTMRASLREVERHICEVEWGIDLVDSCVMIGVDQH